MIVKVKVHCGKIRHFPNLGYEIIITSLNLRMFANRSLEEAFQALLKILGNMNVSLVSMYKNVDALDSKPLPLCKYIRMCCSNIKHKVTSSHEKECRRDEIVHDKVH